MGDNRGDSDDSRYRQNDPGTGTIPESAVVGRAFLIIWPLRRISDLPIPNTFKQPALSAAAAVATAPPATVAGGTAFAGAAVSPCAGAAGAGQAPDAASRRAVRRKTTEARGTLPQGRGDRLRGRDDTLTVMSDDGAARRERTGGAGMSGSDALDGGSPPWGPADPVPDLDDTQAIPGLGSIPGPTGQSPGSDGTGPDGAGAAADAESPDGPAGGRRRGHGKSGEERQAAPQLLARASRCSSSSRWCSRSSSSPSRSRPSGSRPPRWRTPSKSATGCSSTRSSTTCGRSTAATSSSSTAPARGTSNPPASSNIFSKAVDELEGLVGISQDPPSTSSA